MSDNDFSSLDAIRKAEEQGLIFSEDKKHWNNAPIKTSLKSSFPTA